MSLKFCDALYTGMKTTYSIAGGVVKTTVVDETNKISKLNVSMYHALCLGLYIIYYFGVS